MPFITFMYRMEKFDKLFYGKYFCDFISDDHDGLDNEIMPSLLAGINEYRKQNGLSDITDICVGILSFSSHSCVPTYSSEADIKCFDFYHTRIDDICQTYIHGQLLTFGP